MATTIALEFEELATELIAEFGTEASFNVVSRTEYDPALAGPGVSTTTVHSWKVSPLDAYTMYFKGVTTVPGSRGQVIIAAEGIPFTPERGMTLDYLGVTYTIIMLDPIDAGGLIVGYLLHLGDT